MEAKFGLSSRYSLEVLFATSILFLVVVMIVPFAAKQHASIHNQMCLSNMRGIGQALRMYELDYDAFPHPLSPAFKAYLPAPSVMFCPLCVIIS